MPPYSHQPDDPDKTTPLPALRGIRHLTEQEQVIGKLGKKFEAWKKKSGGFAMTEFVPGETKGEGQYVITASYDFSPNFLLTVGFSNRDVKGLEMGHAVRRMLQWNVPPVIMQEAAAQKMQIPPEALVRMPPAELTRELRKLDGHKLSRVREVPGEGGQNYVLFVRPNVSRETLLAEGRNKKEIARGDQEGKQIYIPEAMMHKTLKIGEYKGRA